MPGRSDSRKVIYSESFAMGTDEIQNKVFSSLYQMLIIPLYCFSMLFRMARVNSCVVALPPMSRVRTLPSAMTS